MLLFAMISTTMICAQDKGTGFDGLMRSNGRSYVVVAVMLTILAGLVLYLIRLDRKISRFEKEK
jgi:hypothetical protein